MFVQRELERQYCTAPSAAKCKAGLATPDMRAFECCVGAITTLILVMENLKKVLGWRDLPVANLCADATDLLLLTMYLLRWPLKEAKTYLENICVQHRQMPGCFTEGFQAQIKEMQEYQKEYVKRWGKLRLLTAGVEEKLCSMSETSPKIRERLLGSEDDTNKDVKNIPSLGAVELLLRVVAEAKELRFISA